MRRIPPSRLARVLVTLCSASACAGGGEVPDSGSSTTRDSAGTAIVESTQPVRPLSAGWVVGKTPTLSIGDADGTEPALLFSRVVYASRLDDGRIVVADGQSSQLRWFGPDGRFLRAAGAVGEGPGEFQLALGDAWRGPGDTIVTTDISSRIQLFAPSGAYARTTRLGAPPEGSVRAFPVGQTRDGHFLTVATGASPMTLEAAGRVISDTFRLYSHSPDGATLRPLVDLASAPRWGLVSGGLTFPYVPFAANPVWAAGRDRFYTARGDVPEVSVWRPDGSLDRIVRWRAARRAVTSSDLDAYRAHAPGVSRDPNEARRVEQLLKDAPRTDSLPSIRRMLEDGAGNLWVEAYRHSWEPEPVWQVFDREGRWMAAVRTPPRFRIHQIGDDHLLGVWRDEDDVEHIRVYPLVR